MGGSEDIFGKRERERMRGPSNVQIKQDEEKEEESGNQVLETIQ